MSSNIIHDTLASVIAELIRLDPANLTAARASGVLAAIGSSPSVQREGPGRPKLNVSALDRQMAADYAAGDTILELAKKHGCCVTTARKALMRAGSPIRPRGRGPCRIKERTRQHLPKMLALREEGKTLTEIGSAIGVSRERVRQIFTLAGVPTSLVHRPLTDLETAAVKDYVQGLSLDQASARHGLTAGHLRKMIIRSGNSIRAGRRRPRSSAMVSKAERAAALYTQGKKNAEIASELGLSKPEMIYRLLAIAGVKPSRQRRHLNGTAV